MSSAPDPSQNRSPDRSPGRSPDRNPDRSPASQAAPFPSQAELAALTLRVAALEAQLTAQATTGAVPTPLRPSDPPPLPAPILAPAPPRQSFEDRLGSQIFNFVGAAALLIGASWALKLAFEHGLIGPAGSILIGLAAGTALILWSERFRRRSLPAFSYSLKAVGSGILYLALLASFHLYGLLPANAVCAAMLLVTAWNAFMAWSQDAELLAALPWLMLALSALYLALMRLQSTAAAQALHLALAVVFLTVAFPLKASGHTLTTAWLVEGVVLCRVASFLSLGALLMAVSVTYQKDWLGLKSPPLTTTPEEPA